MKNRWPLFFVLFLLMCCVSLQAGVLADARDQFAKGDYKLAVKLFEQAVKEGSPHATIFYELGQAFSKLGNHAEAALNFRRAVILDPRFTPAIESLHQSNAALGINDAQTDWRNTVSKWLPMDATVFIGTIIFWLGAFWLMLTFFNPTRRRSPAIILISVGILLIALVWLTDPRIIFRDHAMVLSKSGTAILSAPAEQSEKIANVPEGGMIRILSQRGRWMYGESSRGAKGWFPSEGIVPVIPHS